MTSVCTVPGTSAGICRDALQFAVPGGKCGKGKNVCFEMSARFLGDSWVFTIYL